MARLAGHRKPTRKTPTVAMGNKERIARVPMLMVETALETYEPEEYP
jgi:hypothetical protein